MERRTYNIELAVRVGIGQAVLLEDIAYVIRFQDAEQTRELNGQTYMHGHSAAIAERIPEFSINSIKRWLAVLVGAGYLLRESRPHGTSHRRWYAIGPRAERYVGQTTNGL